MTNKVSGRIGDSPLIGCGTYADNLTCAISCTGVGEEFIRAVAAYDISARMAYGGRSLKDAARQTLSERLPKDSGMRLLYLLFQNDFDAMIMLSVGGVIGVTVKGDYVADFNCTGMYRGMLSSDGSATVGIWQEEEAFMWR